MRLVARASLPDRVAGEITRVMLSTKAKLASTLPVVGEMEAPATEKTSVLPAHPGTLAYLNGEQVALLDETLNKSKPSAVDSVAFRRSRDSSPSAGR
jgi:uncharacterized protein